MPQSTKYQLKKDLKRNVGQVPNEISFPESKRTKLTSSQHVETPVKCPNFKSQGKVVEEEEIKKDIMKGQSTETIIKLSIAKLEAVKELVESSVKDFNQRIS